MTVKVTEDTPYGQGHFQKQKTWNTLTLTFNAIGEFSSERCIFNPRTDGDSLQGLGRTLRIKVLNVQIDAQCRTFLSLFTCLLKRAKLLAV